MATVRWVTIIRSRKPTLLQPQSGTARYDPDKSQFYLKKAGLTDLKIELSSSDAAFAGALDAAALFQGQAQKGGIQVNIKRQPADSYWDDVWMKAPFSMGLLGGRPTADQMFSTAYQSTAKWNDTHWKDEKFDALLLQARSLLDEGKRAKSMANCKVLCAITAAR